MPLTSPKIPRHWCNGTHLGDPEMMHIALLRVNGCTCKRPLLGYVMLDARTIRGVRCRLCNHKFTWEFYEEKP